MPGAEESLGNLTPALRQMKALNEGRAVIPGDTQSTSTIQCPTLSEGRL